VQVGPQTLMLLLICMTCDMFVTVQLEVLLDFSRKRFPGTLPFPMSWRQ
jgi:hypothetical protein